VDYITADKFDKDAKVGPWCVHYEDQFIIWLDRFSYGRWRHTGWLDGARRRTAKPGSIPRYRIRS
jgi:hypothetical protein